ncbi:tRNA ligase Ecym_6337 [Eremothecium cymbalariae DBVPG|uniref:tRNA ligase n=1 Tax=Eremothecium cymbalariae (strain CBS 270.75 / DBVPG 7215 / KCTC 17166 / NRRL Y-17582) TaxID=931890 RepID=G8JUD3_ERECY|nr:hypothetical protein Ecym_6337 [Eremothecium cymbalariae DBVPG\
MNGVVAGDFNRSVTELVQELELASKLTKRGKAYKIPCTLFHSCTKVNSWKFNEWDYGKNNVTLPSNARGLFILDDAEKPEIVARGYDKFFNVDEMASTSWKELEKNTSGPYEVTVKENGCIILISGTEDGELVVCSKHSTGPRYDIDRNHAEAGELFLRREAGKLNIDVNKMAEKLYAMKCTAVAEYCDDSFEEHILEYTKDKAGLYLHGLNMNKPKFQTLPMDAVQRFAKEFGFKAVEYFKESDINVLRAFIESCGVQGTYHDQEIEGFVIRCRTKAGDDFFFKYKFEEPYYLYRQWREATRQYIQTNSRIFNFKKHRFITNKYMDFVIPLLENNVELSQQYMRGVGIIKLRKMFLEDYGMTGFEILNSETIKELELKNALDMDKVGEQTKFLLFPIGTVGCGKTTVALALNNLFAETWGHVQNDNITSKDKIKLMKDALELLRKDKIKAVIVDRNNHQYRERKQLFEWFNQLKEDYLPYYANVKFIALSFLQYQDIETAKSITVQRVFKRGDNHQSIKASSDNQKKVFSIINGFINRYEPVNEECSPDNLFDYVIHLNVNNPDSSLINTKLVLNKLHEKYNVLVGEIPSEQAVNKAFSSALNYQPTITKMMGGRSKRSTRNEKYKPVYFAAEINDVQRLRREIDDLIKRSIPNSAGLSSLIDVTSLKDSFHVTLIHINAGKKGTKFEKDMWCEYNKRYNNLLLKNGSNLDKVQPKYLASTDSVKVELKSLLWDTNTVAVLVKVDKECIVDKEGNKVPLLSIITKHPHITIGFIKEGVKAYYSNTLCDLMEEHHFENGSFPGGLNCLNFEYPLFLDSTVCTFL